MFWHNIIRFFKQYNSFLLSSFVLFTCSLSLHFIALKHVLFIFQSSRLVSTVVCNHSHIKVHVPANPYYLMFFFFLLSTNVDFDQKHSRTL